MISPTRQDDPEADLMLRVCGDEPDAFAALMRQLHARVFGQLLHLLHDRQEAEDGAQEVFLRLYRSRARYTPTARFSTWLFHITQEFEHCSCAEIAAALALTPEATKSLLHRARLQMRVILALDRSGRRA